MIFQGWGLQEGDEVMTQISDLIKEAPEGSLVTFCHVRTQ